MSTVIVLDNLLIPRLTTVQRDAISAVNGMRIYNTTDEMFEWFEDGNWTANVSGVTDHGGLTGLSDDDHAQYVLLLGRGGGQTIIGGVNAGADLVLRGSSGSTDDGIIIRNAHDTPSRGVLRLQSERATRANDDEIFIDFLQPDSLGAPREFTRLTSRITEVDEGSRGGAFEFDASVEGTLQRMLFLGTEEEDAIAALFNPDSDGSFQFKVQHEANTSLSCRPGGNVIIGFDGGTGGAPLEVAEVEDAVSQEILRVTSRRATRADDDEIYMTFFQPDSGGNVVETGRITLRAAAVQAGSVGGIMEFETACSSSGGGPLSFLHLDGDLNRVTVNPTGSDTDFFVLAGGSVTLLVCDGGADVVAIGGAAIGGVKLTIENDTNAASREMLRLKSSRATRVDDDEVFQSFYNPGDAGGQQESARITGIITDVTEAGNLEKGALLFEVQSNGSLVEYMRLQSLPNGVNEVVIGDGAGASPGDAPDFRCEVNGDATAFLVDVSSARILMALGVGTDVGIGTAPAAKLHVVQGDNIASKEIIRLQSDRATRLDNDEIYMGWYMPTDGGSTQEYLRMTAIAEDVSNAAKASGFQIEGFQGNVFRRIMTWNATAGVDASTWDFNPDGRLMDFQIQGDGEAQLFRTSGLFDTVAIGTAPISGVMLTIEDDTNTPSIEILRLRSVRATRADNDEIHMSFFQPDAGGVQTESHRIISEMADVSSGTEKTILRIQQNVNGSLTGLLNLGKLANGTNRFGLFGTEASIQIVTQDFSTEDATHANRTAAVLVDNSGGGATDNTIGAIATGGNVGQDVPDAIAELAEEINALRADQRDTAAFLNFIVASLTDHGMFELAGGG